MYVCVKEYEKEEKPQKAALKIPCRNGILKNSPDKKNVSEYILK